MDGWRTDIENAPKDGSEVLFPSEQREVKS
jgi:hypothetical protein